MENFLFVLVIMFFIGLFVAMIIAASMHSWFAFAGFLIAFLLDAIIFIKSSW